MHQPPISCIPMRIWSVSTNDVATQYTIQNLDNAHATEEEIARDAASIIRFKRLLNARRPICQLPFEILGHIFVIRSHPDGVHLQCGHGYTWFRIAHVCHHWRSLVINTPSMWSDIYLPCKSGQLADMVHRSGKSLLTIRSDPLPYPYRHRWT